MPQTLMTAEPISDRDEALWILAHQNSCTEPVHLHFDSFGEITGWFITVPECSESHARVNGYDEHYPVESALAHELISSGVVKQVPVFDRSLFFFDDRTYQITKAEKTAIWERLKAAEDAARTLLCGQHQGLSPEAVKSPYFRYREHGLHGPWRFMLRTPLGDFHVFPADGRVEKAV